MIEPTFDRRGQPGGGNACAGADDLDSSADEVLLRRFRDAQDEAAFSAIVRRHQPMVLRTCLRLAGNVHDAEDAAQSVFLVLAKRPQVVNRSLAGCLHGLARAAVSELRRARRRRTDREEVAARMRSMVDRLQRGGLPVGHQEFREELDAALAQLPDPLQQAVILRYLEGLSQQEAARRAGCTTATMGWRSMKGLERLRGALSRRGVVVAGAAVLAVLGVEAGAAAARGAPAAVTGSASEVAARVAAALLKQVQLGNRLLRVVFAVLLVAGVALGAGIAHQSPLTPAGSQQPTHPAPGPEAARDRPQALGQFDRSLDIGGPSRAGAAQFAGGAYTVRGGGDDIYGKADQFHFVYRPWTGDGEITARVDSDPDQEGRQVYAGVMFRASLAADSHHAAALLEANGTCRFNYRDAANPASACTSADSNQAGKYWVRLVRRGNTFTAFTRPDGAQAWKQVQELELPMPAALYVGLAVTAHDDAQLATTTIDCVSLRGLAKP
jgi:RNA polymerase sigma factor (sigma-70 family)